MTPRLLDLYGADLPSEHAERFTRLMALLREKHRARDVLLVHRGETLEALTAALIRNADGGDSDGVHRRMFYYGVKARRYLADTTGAKDARDFWAAINDTTPEPIGYLFDRIHSAGGHSRRQGLFAQHCSAAFREYFADVQNRDSFVSSLTGLPDAERLTVRDYYLFFLHTLGRLGIHAGTPLVSTTIEGRVARQFARGWRGRNPEPFVIHYFLPRPFENVAILPWESDGMDNLARSVGLPSIPPRGLYPRQWEVAVKGALFPHFVLGLSELAHKTMTPNPHLFSNTNQTLEEVCRSGISIDQGRFPDTIFETAFLGYVVTDQRGQFAEFDVRRP
jgi:hypothetical protein